MSRLRFPISMSPTALSRGPSKSPEDPLGIGGDPGARVGFCPGGLAEPHRLPGGEMNESTAVIDESAGQRRRDDHGPQHVRRPSGLVGSPSVPGRGGGSPTRRSITRFLC